MPDSRSRLRRRECPAGREGWGVRWLWPLAVWVLAGGVAWAAPPGPAHAARDAVVEHGVHRSSAVERAGRPAVIPAAAGRRPLVAERTYLWHGLRVPLGACGAVIQGRAQVLPCNVPAVRRYRARVAQQTRYAWRGGGCALVLTVAGCVWWVGRRRRRAAGQGG